MLKLYELFRDQEIFIISFFSTVQIWVLRVKFFFSFWLIFCPLGLDSDPGSQHLADPTDPDPKHWFNRDFIVQDDDEQDLVGNEEEQAEEIEEIKGNEDFKGKIHYKLEYDFTTQELKVTVSQHSATIIKLD